MYSTILLVALSTVSGHKCHCAAVCSGVSCYAPVTCSACYAPACSGCSCYKVKKHKCGLFKRLFAKKHCSCACSGCAAPSCCEPACCAPAPSCCAPMPSCCDPCACSAPACATPAAPAEETKEAPPAAAEEKSDAGYRVKRSPYMNVSYKTEKAEFKAEPVVIFARR